jgi:hypothetical protein
MTFNRKEYDHNYKQTHKEQTAKNIKDWLAAHPHRRWAQDSLRKHKERYDILISLDELAEIAKSTTYCYYCGRTLIWSGNMHTRSHSPTLDRMHNEKYISKDNCRIICLACNAGKSSDTEDEYINRCRQVVINAERRNSKIS